MEDSHIKYLTDTIRETSFAIHKYLRHGHLEKVYENGLAHRLRKQGLQVDQQQPIQVRDEDGMILGDFIADLLVEKILIVEVKAARTLADEHTAQLLGYLRATNIEHGVLVNFGGARLQIRKFIFNNDGRE